MNSLTIRVAAQQDISALWTLAHDMKLSKDTDYFERQFEYQQSGGREMLIATCEGRDIGYCVLNWEPKYIPFKQRKTPEVQDLNIHRDFRRQGFGRQMIEYCEEKALQKSCAQMGIGVGLGPSYGSAQRLYIKMGYIPDGLGVVYDRKPVQEGELRPVDDHLNLMFLKDLSNK